MFYIKSYLIWTSGIFASFFFLKLEQGSYLYGMAYFYLFISSQHGRMRGPVYQASHHGGRQLQVSRPPSAHQEQVLSSFVCFNDFCQSSSMTSVVTKALSKLFAPINFSWHLVVDGDSGKLRASKDNYNYQVKDSNSQAVSLKHFASFFPGGTVPSFVLTKGMRRRWLQGPDKVWRKNDHLTHRVLRPKVVPLYVSPTVKVHQSARFPTRCCLKRCLTT